MKRIACGMLILIAVLSTACNTMKGVGRDIKEGGQAIEKAADK